MKKMLIVTAVVFGLFSIGSAQQWEFSHLLIDMELSQSNSWGFHGVVVAPDGNIWLALHGDLAQDSTITANGDTIHFRPIYILDPTTGQHVSFSPLRVIEFADGTKDTLHADSPHNGSGKGISLDKDGNILYSSWSTLYRINYLTGEGMNKYTPTDMSSLTEAVQDDNGLIYLSYVLAGSRPIMILDDNFNYIGNAIDTLGYINRTLAVSSDGKELYTGSTWNGFGVVHYHSDIPGVVKYTAVDTIGNWDSVYVAETDTTYYDVKLWASCLDWGPDGNLWAGNLRDDWSSGGAGTGSQWYVFDPSTGERLYSVGEPFPFDSSAGGVYSPRGAAWSANGNTMYLADFDYNTVGVWTRVTGSVEGNLNIPVKFILYQNYPNPFNPVTRIPFEIMKNEVVKLIIYDMLGQKVVTLIDKPMLAGRHEVSFDASGLATGVYFYRLTLGDRESAKRMIYMK